MLNTNLVKTILNEYKNNSISLAQAIDMLNILYTHPNPLRNPGNSPEISEELPDILKIKDILPLIGLEDTRANQMKAAEVLNDLGYTKTHTWMGNVWMRGHNKIN